MTAPTMPADAAEIVRLAERVEQATGPDRQLDYAIGAITGVNKVPADLWPVMMAGSKSDLMVPIYTASLDAAMTLVPEDGFWELNAHSCAKVTVDVRYGSGADWWFEQETFEANAATHALALTAAALRARAAQHDHEVG